LTFNLRPRANADLKDSEPKSVLGLVPHQIRGFLAQFSNMLLVGHGYDKCTACSDSILEEYRNSGNEFLIQGLKDPSVLERVAGLEKMKQDVQDQQDDFEWDDEDAL
jgi:ubiquitin-like modifier-activating enzyme ATG7